MNIKLDEGYWEAQVDEADAKLDRAKEDKLTMSEDEHREMYPWFYPRTRDEDKWSDT